MNIFQELAGCPSSSKVKLTTKLPEKTTKSTTIKEYNHTTPPIIEQNDCRKYFCSNS